MRVATTLDLGVTLTDVLSSGVPEKGHTLVISEMVTVPTMHAAIQPLKRETIKRRPGVEWGVRVSRGVLVPFRDWD